MIQLRNVTKKFGANTAVDDLSLTVGRGEIFGLLGHNGAGKSTAIGMMLGQVWPTAGEVRLCGYDITADRNKALEKVGAIFEAPAFYNELSGWRNLEILSSYTAPTRAERIGEVVDWVGLNGRARGLRQDVFARDAGAAGAGAGVTAAAGVVDSGRAGGRPGPGGDPRNAPHDSAAAP